MGKEGGEDGEIRERVQPVSVRQGRMDSDSGEQSDGDLSPGGTWPIHLTNYY